jgi:hypothetical protein
VEAIFRIPLILSRTKLDVAGSEPLAHAPLAQIPIAVWRDKDFYCNMRA